MSTGARLRRARLEAGQTLDQVSESTKIPLWILHSIERDDFSQVPGGIFIRGYLSSFARAVRVDTNEILTSHFGPPPDAVPAPAPEVRRPGYTGTPLWQVAALIALIIATAVVWRNAWKGASNAQATAPARTEVSPPIRAAAPPPPLVTSAAQPVNAVDQPSSIVSAPAPVAALAKQTPPPVVAPSDATPTSASDDPIAVSNERSESIEPIEPTEPSELSPSEPTAPTELSEPN